MSTLKCLSLSLLLLLALSSYAQQDRGFFKQYRLSGKEVPSGIVDVKDGWIIAGNTTTRYEDKIDLPQFGYLMKIDLQGQLIWKRFYGDTINWDMFYAMFFLETSPRNCIKSLKNGDLIIMGNTSMTSGYGNTMLMRIEPQNGDIRWVYRDTFPDQFNALSVDEDTLTGDLYALSSRQYFNRNGYPCIYKLNKDGKRIWKKHYKNFDQEGWGCHGSYLFCNGQQPFFLVNKSTKTSKDSCLLVKLNPNTGAVVARNFICHSFPVAMYKIHKGYNILFQETGQPPTYYDKIQIYLDTALNISKTLSLNFLIDQQINPFMGDGYSTYDEKETCIKLSDPSGKIYLKYGWSGLNYIGQKFVRKFENESAHGGIYQLGYINLNAEKGYYYTYQFCEGDNNCTDIYFIKSDPDGKFQRGPKQPQIGEVLIYPNPVKGEMKIRFDLSEAAHVGLCIRDVLGRVVLSQPKQWFSDGYQEMNIHTEQLSAGIYFVSIDLGNGNSQLLKVIVE